MEKLASLGRDRVLGRTLSSGTEHHISDADAEQILGEKLFRKSK